MTNAYIVTGTLTDAQTVRLDEPLPLPTGKVRVVVEVAAADASAQPSFRQVVQAIWEAQRRRGHVPRTAEEIQAQVREERESWGD
jgi:hypothetical protein